jgi:diguanylate cyclase (GGDEF)-like protein
MLTISTIIAAGPCLIAAMAAVALFIVHRSLSRVRHALIWAAAFALTAVRWGVIGFSDIGRRAGATEGLGFSPLGMLAMLLLAEGFRVRTQPHRLRWMTPLAAVVAVPVQIMAYTVQGLAIRLALVPLMAGLLILWTTTLVVPHDRRASTTELTVIAILALLATVELGGVVLAIGEQFGLVPQTGAYVALFSVALQPICAALGMSTLLLIAFDFSAEQRRLIHTDPLTGVLNRMGFRDAARGAMERRRPRPLSIALTDLDGFKGVNDSYGHATGDETLAGFAAHLAEHVERDEAVARFGGEEFALLLPGSDGQTAFARIEVLRIGLAGLSIANAPDLAVRASFGIAERRPGEPLESLIERADEALYRSKREGRNRSTLAPLGDGAPC